MATERELNILIKARDEASRILRKYEQEFNAMGQGLLAAGAAGAAGLGFAIKAAGDFEAQMDAVAAVSGATAREQKMLEKVALDLGASTKFSAQEAAIGMELMAANGFTAAQVADSMSGVLAAAAASGMDLGRTADIISGALKGFQLEAKESNRVADVMAMVANTSAAQISDLGETFKYVAPIAAAAGYELEDLSAAAGIMGNNMIKGSEAGTALRGMIMRLQAPTAEADHMMRELGISVRDANGEMKPIPAIVAEFEKGFKGVNRETKDFALKTIIGMEAASGFQSLLNAGSDELIKYGATLRDSGGSAAAVAAQKMDNMKGAIEEMMGALETAAIILGSTFTPYVRKAAEIVGSAIDVFNELPESVQKTIGKILVAGTAFSLLTGALMIVLPMLPFFGAAIAAIFSPIGLLIIALGALGTAFATNIGGIRGKIMTWIQPMITAFQYLRGDLDQTVLTGRRMGEGLEAVLGEKAFAIVTIIQNLRTGITTAFQQLQAILMPLVQMTWDWIKSFIAINGDLILGYIKYVWTAVSSVISSVFGFIVRTIDKHGADILKIVTGAFDSVWKVISTVLKIVTDLVGIGWSFINELIYTHGDQIVSNVMKAFKGIQQAIDTAADVIVSIIEWAWPYLQQIIEIVLQQVIPWAISMFNKIAAFIGDVMPKIVKVIQWAWESVIKPLFTAVMNFLVPFIKGAWTAISNIIGGVMDFVMGIIKTVLSIVTGDWSGAWEGIKQTLSGAVQAIKGILQAIKEILVAPFKLGLEAIKGLATSFYNVGKDMIKGLINGIKAMAGAAIDAAKGAVKGALEGAKKLLGINSPSRVFMEIGAFTSEGLAIGIMDAASMARRASEDLAKTAISPVSGLDVTPSYAGGYGAAGGGKNITLNFEAGSIVLPEVRDPEDFGQNFEQKALGTIFKAY